MAKKKRSISKKELRVQLAKERTELSEKRTRLAYERTLMANIRTAITIILFGIAFLGLTQVKYDFYFIAALLSIIFGLSFIIVTIILSLRHLKDIERISSVFKRLWFLTESEQDLDDED